MLDNNHKLMYTGGMKTELGDLEPYWNQYLGWCNSGGLRPDFSDFMVWMDDQDITAKLKVLDEWLIEGKYSDPV